MRSLNVDFKQIMKGMIKDLEVISQKIWRMRCRMMTLVEKEQDQYLMINFLKVDKV